MTSPSEPSPAEPEGNRRDRMIVLFLWIGVPLVLVGLVTIAVAHS